MLDQIESAVVSYLEDVLEGYSPMPTIRTATNREEFPTGVPVVVVAVRSLMRSAGPIYSAELVVVVETPVIVSVTVAQHKELVDAVEFSLNPRTKVDVTQEEIEQMTDVMNQYLQGEGFAWRGSWAEGSNNQHNDKAWATLLRLNPFGLERL